MTVLLPRLQILNYRLVIHFSFFNGFYILGIYPRHLPPRVSGSNPASPNKGVLAAHDYGFGPVEPPWPPEMGRVHLERAPYLPKQKMLATYYQFYVWFLWRKNMKNVTMKSKKRRE